MSNPTLQIYSKGVRSEWCSVVFCAKAKKCTVPQVEQQIKLLTDKHATGDQFISSEALFDAMCVGQVDIDV